MKPKTLGMSPRGATLLIFALLISLPVFAASPKAKASRADSTWAKTSGVNLVFSEKVARNDKVSTKESVPFMEPEPRIKVILDPGHGGKDLGAQGHHSVSEKDISFKIAKAVQRELERIRNTMDIPIEGVLTRDGDYFVPLKERVRIANDWNADLFVSIHANSSNYPKANGFEVYFLSAEGSDEEARRLALIESEGKTLPKKSEILSILSDVQTNFHIENSSELAEIMFSAISQKILSRGRGVRQGPFTVLAGTAMPAVLVEVGYVTNVKEALNLTKEAYLKRLASAISTGIVEFATKRKKVSWNHS